MKKVLITLSLLLCTLFAFAQEEERAFYPIDWKQMAEVVKSNPDSVRTLVKRLTTVTLDKTLTYPERQLAFYGITYLSNNNKVDQLLMTAHESLKTKDYDHALNLTKEALEENPLSLEGNKMMADIIRISLKDSTKTSPFTPKDREYYGNMMFRIMNTIATTGYGSEEYPFAVTMVSDEYIFNGIYLEIETGSQYLLGKSYPCDKFDVKEKSQYFSADEIYFDITRVFEIRRQKLNE